MNKQILDILYPLLPDYHLKINNDTLLVKKNNTTLTLMIDFNILLFQIHEDKLKGKNTSKLYFDTLTNTIKTEFNKFKPG